VRDLHAGAARNLDAVEPLVGADLDFFTVDDDCGHGSVGGGGEEERIVKTVAGTFSSCQ
jgi:hypothetical protein